MMQIEAKVFKYFKMKLAKEKRLILEQKILASP